MIKRQINELYIKVKDDKGEESWVSMTEFSKALIETIGEAINLTFKEIGKEIKSLSKTQANSKEFVQ